MSEINEHSVRNAVTDPRYAEERKKVDAAFSEQNLLPDSWSTHDSPSGQYHLTVHDCDERGFDYSRGQVSRGGRPIAEVRRSDCQFFFGWAEGHANGHDYLLCGEHLYGQTVIELDTGHRVDFITEDGRDENSFICTDYYPSPDRRFIVVGGCYWACPFDLVICRFANPMALPWIEIDRGDGSNRAEGWNEEGFVFETSDDVRASDGKSYSEMTIEERTGFLNRRQELGATRKRRFLWMPDMSKRFLSEVIVPNSPQ